jgi:EAL domain-containing protein (putative c-di-GMP-specific phosphodiesterase class I)
MEFAYKLEEVLTKSVEKNGEQQMTTKHLLNIVRMCIRQVEADDIEHQQKIDDALNDALNDF